MSKDYPVSLFRAWNSEIVSQAHKDPYTLNKKIFQKFKKLKFYPKITYNGAKKDDHYPINSVNYAAANYQTLEGVPESLEPEKNFKGNKKLQIFKENA